MTRARGDAVQPHKGLPAAEARRQGGGTRQLSCVTVTE